MPAPQPTVNLKLLIVDDDPNTRDLLAEALEVRGARVRALGSASEARTTLVAWHPDLMISDVGMPRENGYELIRRVRHLSVRDGGTTPAIACTGYTRPEDRARAMRAGFDAVVTKPVNLEELLQTIVLSFRPLVSALRSGIVKRVSNVPILPLVFSRTRNFMR